MTNFKESSKTEWYNEKSKQGEYPGDTNIIIGCMQRIALATEKMADDREKLIQKIKFLEADRDRYQNYYFSSEKSRKALKGVITRLRNKMGGGVNDDAWGNKTNLAPTE